MGKLIVLMTFAAVAHADLVTVGSLVYANPLSVLQGFEVVNETGPVDGCDAPDGIPVCTVLTFQNTSLTVTLSDNSTITRTPSGGFAFSPGAYIYGLNPGDDVSQSFLFDIDPSLSIVSATFTGTVAPSTFQITDGTNESTVFSNGLFSDTLDLSSGPPLAAGDITLNLNENNPEPEPARLLFPLSLLAAAMGLLRIRKSMRERG